MNRKNCETKFPSRHWFRTENGWASEPVTNDIIKARMECAKSINATMVVDSRMVKALDDPENGLFSKWKRLTAGLTRKDAEALIAMLEAQPA